jgi:hypothetical protein
MNFIEALPKSEGMYTIMVAMDIKYAYFIALAYPFSAQEVAYTFLDLFISLMVC